MSLYTSAGGFVEDACMHSWACMGASGSVWNILPTSFICTTKLKMAVVLLWIVSYTDKWKIPPRIFLSKNNLKLSKDRTMKTLLSYTCSACLCIDILIPNWWEQSLIKCIQWNWNGSGILNCHFLYRIVWVMGNHWLQ